MCGTSQIQQLPTEPDSGTPQTTGGDVSLQTKPPRCDAGDEDSGSGCGLRALPAPAPSQVSPPASHSCLHFRASTLAGPCAPLGTVCCCSPVNSGTHLPVALLMQKPDLRCHRERCHVPAEAPAKTAAAAVPGADGEAAAGTPVWPTCREAGSW